MINAYFNIALSRRTVQPGCEYAITTIYVASTTEIKLKPLSRDRAFRANVA